MGLQIVLLSLILEFRRETRSKCPRTSENKNFIPVSIGIFMVAQHPSPRCRCINRIRIVQFIRFAPDLGRICTGPPHIHNLQAIHFSLPSAFSAFSIPKPGSEGCWAAEQKIANYPCVCICSILGTHPPCPPFHSQFSVEEIVSLSKKVRIVVSFTR